MRGEDQRTAATTRCAAETPPRAWRRFTAEAVRITVGRNTSTCVEKINEGFAKFVQEKKHLHVRGEDQSPAVPEAPVEGNTSTCVEKIKASKGE